MPQSDTNESLRHERQFAAFAMLLALGVLFHQTTLSDWSPFSHHLPVSLAAFFVLWRPTSLIPFVTMVLCHLGCLLIDLPFVPNHWLFVGFLDLAVLMSLGAVMLRHRRWKVSKGELYQTLAPTLRWSVLVMYMFAALAKLNWDFFNPELSAATSLFDGLASKVKVLPTSDGMHWLAIYGTALLECVLPPLLFFRRTRTLGVIVALAFHFVMGVAGFIPFSGFAVAFLFLFTPEDLVDRYFDWKASHPRAKMLHDGVARVVGNLAFPLIACSVWILIAFTRTYAWLPPAEVRLAVIRVGQGLFGMYYLLLGFLLFQLLRTRSEAPAEPARMRFAHPVLAIIPLALILNGLSPYLGLKTEGSFTMYSNLQTEGEQWNHLFMPASLRVFGMQNELVRIVESNHPPFQRAAEEDIQLTWFEFHREAAQRPGLSVVYEYQGRTFEVADASIDSILSTAPSLAMQKMLWFREVPAPEKNTIRH